MAKQAKNLDAKKPSSTRANKKAKSTLEQALFDPDQSEQYVQTDHENSPVTSNTCVTSGEMYSTPEDAKSITALEAAPQHWLFVTNHLNLLYMLAAGMIMSPAGFNEKHYPDPSSSFPGWLPLFRGSIPQQAIDSATQATKYLLPCVVAINLDSIQAQVLLQSRDGAFSKCSLPSKIDDNISALLIRAPLPLALIKDVYFCSQDDLAVCHSAASNSANTDTSRISFKIDPKPFEDTSTEPWPVAAENMPSDLNVKDAPPAQGQATGGVVAVLYHIANRSSLCCCAYRIATGSANNPDFQDICIDPTLAHLLEWLNTGIVSGDATEAARLYWDVAVELVEAKSKANSPKPVDVVLAYLSGSIPKLQDPELKKSVTTLYQDLRSSFGLGAGTISELFERNTEPLSRSLILLCLRASSTDLLRFSHASLSDVDFILAAILFGIRDGWLGLPQDLRRPNALVQFVESRMIEVEQRDRDEKVISNISNPRPVPLRELLITRCFEMGVARREALVHFVQSQGWKEAVQTTIRLPEARYHLIASQEGVEIIVKGGITSLSLDIDLETILRKISVWPFEHEDEIRTILQIE